MQHAIYGVLMLNIQSVLSHAKLSHASMQSILIHATCNLWYPRVQCSMYIFSCNIVSCKHAIGINSCSMQSMVSSCSIFNVYFLMQNYLMQTCNL